MPPLLSPKYDWAPNSKGVPSYLIGKKLPELHFHGENGFFSKFAFGGDHISCQWGVEPRWSRNV